MSSSRPPQLAQRPLTIEPGTRLDRYELLCVLAHGGMANIWLARVQGKAGFEKLYAIKTILPNVADDPTFKDMFLDEARIASRITHPNVVHMVDVGEFHGTPYLVMDLVEGEPLYKLPRACEKRGTRMPLGVVLRILADACHGLHAAHELTHMGTPLNVVHRDVSPQNILVSTAGMSKVIDFGVAKARDRATAETSAGTLKGKISYMPTEQARGHEVDRRADTWALGAVLYWLLAGRPPYKEDNQLATLQLAVTAAPIPPLPESVPFALRMIVMQALEHDRNDRFQTAENLGDALEALMRKLGVSATHADVASFVEAVMGDRIAMRKQQIAAALGEAENRERARDALTIPIDLDESESGSIDKNGIVDIPAAISSALMEAAPITAPMAVRPLPLMPLELEPPQPPSTTTLTGEAATTGAGTFIATQARQAPRKRWPLLAVGAALALMGIVGIILIVITLKNGVPDRPVANAASAKPVVTQPTPTTPPPEPATTPAPTTKPVVTASASASSTSTSTPKVQPTAWPTATQKTIIKKRHDDDPGF